MAMNDWVKEGTKIPAPHWAASCAGAFATDRESRHLTALQVAEIVTIILSHVAN